MLMPNIFRALEYLDLNAGSVQEQGGRQAAYAAAGDQCLHRPTRRFPGSSERIDGSSWRK
jgi:hypothetical protein